MAVDLEQGEYARTFRCEFCKGVGNLSRRNCSRCSGKGEVIVLKDHYAYWPKAIRFETLKRERINLFARSAVRFLLLCVAVSAGFWFLATVILSMAKGALLSEKLFLSTTPQSFFFWIGSLAFLLLYASYGKVDTAKMRIPVRSYRKHERVKERSLAIFKEPGVSIYQVLHPEVKQLLLSVLQENKRMRGLNLFTSLLATKQIMRVLARLGISRQQLQAHVQAGSKKIGSDRQLGLQELFFIAYQSAYDIGDTQLYAGHLFYALVYRDPLMKEVLLDMGIETKKIQHVLQWLHAEDALFLSHTRTKKLARLRPRARIDRAMTALATPHLDAYSVDITEQVARSRVLPVVPRAIVTNGLIRAIEAGQVPLLVGNPGVGVRSILQEVATRMVNNDVPKSLQDRRLVSLSLPRLVSGVTADKASARLLAILSEASRAGNIVLVIRDVHGAIGMTSGREGSVDLAEVLSTGLQSWRGRCIATTVPSNERGQLSGTRLYELFEPLQVAEPEIDEAVPMVQGQASMIESKHHTFFSYDSIYRLVQLCDQFIHDKYLPLKAVELLDELALYVRDVRGTPAIVQDTDVNAFMEQKFSLPVRKVQDEEADLLLNLEERIHERLVNQKRAVVAVANALRRARTALGDTTRPIASLLFLGPTGVGKTELAKAVTALYFSDDRSMIRLDMSEYQDHGSIGRLIGEHGMHGHLTEALRRQPFSLLLLDELEKAHKDVLNLFLQVMDDGRLTDASGETVDVTNAIVIATSNAGSEYIQRAITSGISSEELEQTLLQEELPKVFSPEFINRFDGVMVFEPLTKEHVLQITHLLLQKVQQRLTAQGIAFAYTEEAVGELASLGFDQKFGARPLRRVIQNRVDGVIAKFILEGKVRRRDKLVLSAAGVIQIEPAESIK